ncbi:hypothetical protein [Kaistella sp.]|uniref:hypothetical protein n=1 Tax=Kaistella sp. TaxID=2782235 RepID=UPI003C58FCF1
MKTLILIPLFATSLLFAQDLTKAQAKQNFTKSENRKLAQIEIKDFERIYKNALCVKKYYNVNLKEMPIFIKKAKDSSTYMPYHMQVIYNLDDVTIAPENKKCNF